MATPTNPKPDCAARDPQIRRQYITQRWVDENGITPGCPRCEGRGTTGHSKTCRKRFDAIGKKKLDKQMEEAAMNAEPPPVIAAEMEVEQPREPSTTGGASFSSAPAPSGQEADRCQVPVLTKCGWRSVSRRPASRDRWKGVMRVRANE